jgi:hypothetical protein
MDIIGLKNAMVALFFLARSPVSLEVGSNRGTCVTDVQLSHTGLIVVVEAVDEDYTLQKP